MAYNAKQDLYRHVDRLRAELGFDLKGKPINTVEICRVYTPINYVYHAFETEGFGGAAFVGQAFDTIVLNSLRSDDEQNFDCGHEILHLSRHRNIQDTFNCFTYTKQHQNTFIEWEANEGSAQFTVPYQDFIPRFCTLFSCVDSWEPIDICGCLAEYYHVPPRVIDIRLDSLAYEIDQFRNGIPIEDVELLSRNQRIRRGITPTNYRAHIAFPLSWDAVI